MNCMEIKYPKKSNCYSKFFYDHFLSENEGKGYEELLKIAENKGMGFAFVYFYHVLGKSTAVNERWSYLLDSNNLTGTALNTLNEVDEDLKEDIALILHQYIMERNGVIDSWPEPYVPNLFTTKANNSDNAKSLYFRFNYFGGEFRSDYTEYKDESGRNHQKVTIKPGANAVYQNHYIAPHTKEYASYISRLADAQNTIAIESKYTSGNGIQKFKFGITVLPAILGIFIGIMMCYWTFTDTGSITDIKIMQILMSMFGSDNVVLKILSFIPMIIVGMAAIVWYIVAFIGWIFHIEKILVPIGAVMVVLFMIGVCGLVEDFIGSASVKDDSNSKKKIDEARNTIKKIQKDRNFIYVKERNALYKKDQEAISEQWHKRWYTAWEEKHDMLI